MSIPINVAIAQQEARFKRIDAQIKFIGKRMEKNRRDFESDMKTLLARGGNEQLRATNFVIARRAAGIFEWQQSQLLNRLDYLYGMSVVTRKTLEELYTVRAKVKKMQSIHS